MKTISNSHPRGQGTMVPKDGPIVVYALDKQTTSMTIAKQVDNKIWCMFMKFIMVLW